MSRKPSGTDEFVPKRKVAWTQPSAQQGPNSARDLALSKGRSPEQPSKGQTPPETSPPSKGRSPEQSSKGRTPPEISPPSKGRSPERPSKG